MSDANTTAQRRATRAKEGSNHQGSDQAPLSAKQEATSDLPSTNRMPARGKKWLVYAIASGACAAINGTFAKLTTTNLTTSLAATLAGLLHIPPSYTSAFDYLVRGAFFGLNLLFDALMWGLFTRALTLAASTVHVSVLNSSANFLIAGLAGLFVFGESLPPLWFVGAGVLLLGCWVIGRRETEPGTGTGVDAKSGKA